MIGILFNKETEEILEYGEVAGMKARYQQVKCSTRPDRKDIDLVCLPKFDLSPLERGSIRLYLRVNKDINHLEKIILKREA